MPWSYAIYPELNLATTTASGIVTEEELLRGVLTAYSDPRFNPDLRAFLDYSQAVEWQVSAEFMARLAPERKFSANSRTAIWAVGPLNYGMCRIYQSFVDAGVVRIFSERADALAWLNEGYPAEKHLG
jgi:hypothetical protein